MNENNMNSQQPVNASTPADNGGQGGEKMFTQAQVNDIVRERLAREREKFTQQTKDDERETALREREQAGTARENYSRCSDYLAEINMSEKYRGMFLEALDTVDFDKFKTIVDKIGGGYIVHEEIISNCRTPTPARNSVQTAESRIADAFRPKK